MEASVGITSPKDDSLVAFIDEVTRCKFTVSMRRFGEFLGRLEFAARIFPWLKAHLASLYSWAAPVDRSTVATVLKLFRLVLKFIKQELTTQSYMLKVRAVWNQQGEQFRSDAKCEVGAVTFGGCKKMAGGSHSLSGRKMCPPYLFKADGLWPQLSS